MTTLQAEEYKVHLFESPQRAQLPGRRHHQPRSRGLHGASGRAWNGLGAKGFRV